MMINSEQNNVVRSQLSSLLSQAILVADEGAATGEFNMQRDLELAESTRKTGYAHFRVYGWHPFAVSLGYNQKADEHLQKRCAEVGYEVVRRPTGGRAVLHANEITYCLTCVLPEGVTQHDVYREVHVDLLRALKNLGADQATFQKQQTDFRKHYTTDESAACFSASARWELEWNQKKLVGSAQRLLGNVLLQHGSIPLQSGFENIVDVTSNSPEKLKRFLLEKAATVSDACGRAVEYSEARDAILTAIAD